MINEISSFKPHIPTLATVISGSTGITLWMQEATGMFAFATAVGAFLTMSCGLAYWVIKLIRFHRDKSAK